MGNHGTYSTSQVVRFENGSGCRGFRVNNDRAVLKVVFYSPGFILVQIDTMVSVGPVVSSVVVELELYKSSSTVGQVGGLVHVAISHHA